MSRPIIISSHQGIAPRYDPALKKGFARTAENCDLSSGKIKPLADTVLQKADTNLYNSLFFYNGAWQTGNNMHYLSWKIGNYDLLIYLSGGVPYKKVNGTAAPLGQTRPSAPTVASNGAGVLSDTFYYIITLTRSVNGYTDESGPSSSANLTVGAKKILVTRPAISDSNVTHWNIYRMSNDSGEYQFVAQVAAGWSTYEDNNADADLGASPTTWYTSDQGNSISFNKPQVTFDGLITEPFTGMIFAWKGPTLYWSEPGYPDAWPSFYNMNMPSDIKRVIPFAGTVAVLTETGPLRVDGTHPELLQPSKVLGEEPCIGTAACKTSKGVAYLSDSGTVLFNLAETIVVSDDRFTEDWFKNNVSSAGAFMIENDGVLYLFHSAGVLVVDTRPKTAIWFTLDIIAYAGHVRPDTGDLYYIDSAGVQKPFSGSGVLAWTWQSGDIVGAHPGDKPFQGIEVIGSGTITATLYADDVQQATKALSFAMERYRTLNFPAETNVRAMQYKLTGTGQVNEVVVRYSP